MITTERPCTASAATVHRLLVDVDAWAVWSPHVASVDAADRVIHSGWTGRVRAFFSPAATVMHVDAVFDDGGYHWSSSLGPWRLRYENRVEPDRGLADADHSVIRFAARLDGPASGLIEPIVAPLSAWGQRRRMDRLARAAELIERQR